MSLNTAVLLVARQDGRAGVGRLLRRALAWRIPGRWLLLTLLLPLALAGAALALSEATGGPRLALPLLAQPLAILPTFLFILVFQGPVPEEFGWRGYALDRLQARWGAVGASLVLGVLWATWHLPLFFTAGYLHQDLPFWAFAVQVTGATVVLTWLYNHTGRNLLVALLFHAAWNLAIALFPPIAATAGADPRAFLYLTGLYALAAALVVWRWDPQTLTWPRHAPAPGERATPPV